MADLKNGLTPYIRTQQIFFFNNYLSKALRLQSNTCPGSPLSLLFTFFLEPTARLRRTNQRIHGFNLGLKEFKISLYADDVA